MALLSVLIIIIAVLLILVVIIQNSKGGGLDANLASQNQSFGAKKTTEIIEKVTWYLIGALAILCIISTKSISGGSDKDLGDAPTQVEQVTDSEEGEGGE
ncbi:preprotein translocase subunit SecG [Flavobacteriales bacterium]|jgi:preprotein translocase subunit SecG|nr:preprotein translocase subunit SecG [Flavobacteriales bacterium]|tara:strand:- start:138 stop:437 length:300 start_codon:yes stop_codon:yes gene_type:complete